MFNKNTDCTIAVVVEAGFVQSIITDCPDQMPRINFIVIDYNEEDDNPEKIPVLQSDGTVAHASVELIPLEEAVIDLKGVIDSISKPEDQP